MHTTLTRGRQQTGSTAESNSNSQSPQEAWSDSDTSLGTRGENQKSQQCPYVDRVRYPTLSLNSSRMDPSCLARNAVYSTWRGVPSNFIRREESDGEYTDEEKPGAFRRQYGIRQSERPNTRYGYDYDNKIFRTLQRNKTGRRSFNPPRNVKFNLRRPEELVSPAPPNPTPPKKVSKSKLASLWRKLTGASTKPKESEHLKSKTCISTSFSEGLDGIKHGNEITIVVCGEAKVGKSSLIENIAIAVGLSDDGLILMDKLEDARNRKAARRIQSNTITLKWKHDGEFFLVKIFEMDLSAEESYVNSVLSRCDAGILVIAKNNPNSMLASINTSKLLSNHHLPFVFVSNQLGSEKPSEKSCLRKLVERMSAACFEMDLGKAENISLQVIESCVHSVLSKRNMIANIWGADL